MSDASLKLCLIATDAVSFNVLYRGQLEYLVAQGAELTLICGGSVEEINRLKARNVGIVIDIGFVRNPSAMTDLLTLLKLVWHFLWARYTTAVYTTPKALLLGGIATWLTWQNRRVAFFQGRVYENFHGWKRRVYVLFDRITVALAHDVLFVSESLMYEYAAEIPGVIKKGGVLGTGSVNGVDVKMFSQATFVHADLMDLRQDLGLAASDFVAIIVGRINTDKGIAEIAQVVDQIQKHEKQIRFVFIGAIEDAVALDILDQLITTHAVRHVPFSSDIARYMAMADVHLFLSHREGFGNVAIEAASLGKPTIAFDVVGVRDSVAEGISGWRVPIGDTSAVVDKILELASAPEQFNAAGARDWVVEKFQQDSVWQIYATFLLQPYKRHS